MTHKPERGPLLFCHSFLGLDADFCSGGEGSGRPARNKKEPQHHALRLIYLQLSGVKPDGY
jgi:hypothetical protein